MMLRRLIFAVPELALSVALVSLAFFLLSCGSSSSGGSGKSGPFNVVGNWQVGLSSAVSAFNDSGPGAIDSAGLAAFFDTSGNIFQLPIITGATSFSGNITAYAVNGNPFSGGLYSITGAAQGTVSSATVVGGTFTASSASGSFTVSPNSPITGSVISPSGTYNAKLIGFSDVVSFTFTPGGTFTGSDSPNNQASGCGFSGTLTQQGSSNVFDVSYSTTVTNGCVADTETGIGFESSTDYFNVNNGADSTYLYAILLTSTVQSVRPYVVVIYQ